MAKVKFPAAKDTPSATVVEEAVRDSLNKTAASRKRIESNVAVQTYAETFFKQNSSAKALFLHVVRYKKSGKKVLVVELPRGTKRERNRSVDRKAVDPVCHMKFTRLHVKSFVVPAQDQIRSYSYMRPGSMELDINIDTSKLNRGSTYNVKGSSFVKEILDQELVSK